MQMKASNAPKVDKEQAKAQKEQQKLEMKAQKERQKLEKAKAVSKARAERALEKALENLKKHNVDA